MSNSNISHNLSLKVMRLSRPSLPAQQITPFEPDPHQSTHAALARLHRNDGILGLVEQMRLPASFGNIYLGETFSSFLSINNDSHLAVSGIF
jgi:hypothetical protein